MVELYKSRSSRTHRSASAAIDKHLCTTHRALVGPEVRAQGPWKSNGTLVKCCLRPNGPPIIGELVMYFNGGTLQILLGDLENSSGRVLGPSTKNIYREPWNMWSTVQRYLWQLQAVQVKLGLYSYICNHPGIVILVTKMLNSCCTRNGWPVLQGPV